MTLLKLVMTGLLIPSSALAAGTQQPSTTWAQEPTSFMGVDLQGDFLNEVAECPANATTSTTLCRAATETPGRFVILGTDSRRVLLGYKLVAQVVNGKIETLVFTGPSNSSGLVAEMLRADYGPPSQSKSNLIKTKSGASFDNEVLHWTGKSLSIKSQRNDADLGTYNVMLTTTPMSVSNAQGADQPDESGVSQL
ncbi:hypothetical protein [Pseudomonas sp. H9]|uniref:hypothetical protein n=1 Tax=Pseudomonas sp. H9 TaxID=483968 RepID=UPI001057F8DA|nr:hypothetical protein [Pseudomonas sp. H9]TDF81479.1 hypothetical protein E1573_16975 [Pseudomonas sp. H9]